jgi:nitrate reductase NapE component
MEEIRIRLNSLDSRISAADSKSDDLHRKVDSKLAELVTIVTSIARLQEREISISNEIKDIKETNKEHRRTDETEHAELEAEVERIKQLIEHAKEHTVLGIDKVREANKDITDDAFIKLGLLEQKIDDHEKKIDSYINKGTGIWWVLGIVVIIAYGLCNWLFTQATDRYDDMKKQLTTNEVKISDLTNKSDRRITDVENNTLELWRKVSKSK